jgi:hypothetical protein
LTHNANGRIRKIVETPPTHKAQLEALFKSLGNAADFPAAYAALTSLQATAASTTTFVADQQAFFELLGAKDQAGALNVVTQLQSDCNALYKSLGATDIAGAIATVTQMQADRDAIWKALGATDHAGAVAAVPALNARVLVAENAQKDFDARLEAGISKGVIDRAAAAGITAPIAKVTALPLDAAAAAEAQTPRSRLAASINEQIEGSLGSRIGAS